MGRGRSKKCKPIPAPPHDVSLKSHPSPPHHLCGVGKPARGEAGRGEIAIPKHKVTAVESA